MTEHGWDSDEWPEIFPRVLAADILVVAGPIWLGDNSSVTKLIIEPSSERVLGVGIVGVGAGELISEGALAVEMGATAQDVAETIHPHPTLSETLKEAAEAFYGYSTHTLSRKRTAERKPATEEDSTPAG